MAEREFSKWNPIIAPAKGRVASVISLMNMAGRRDDLGKFARKQGPRFWLGLYRLNRKGTSYDVRTVYLDEEYLDGE